MAQVDVNVVFAHTRFNYSPYTDYRKLVELAGFETCYVDEIDVTRPETIYVVSPINGEYRPARDNWRGLEHNAMLVTWCLERPSDGCMGDFIRVYKELLNDWYVDHVWLSDRWLVDQVRDKRVTYAMLGSHKGLGQLGNLPDTHMQWDVVHLSCITHRRRVIWEELERHGVRIAENAWAETRQDEMLRTKFLVNVHQDDWPIIEPLRFALAASYGIPVITEECHDAFPYSDGGSYHYIIQKPYDALVQEIVHRVKEGYGSHKAMGIRMYEAMTTEYEFGRQVRIAAEETWKARHKRKDITIR
jgi:hypothetical protein